MNTLTYHQQRAALEAIALLRAAQRITGIPARTILSRSRCPDAHLVRRIIWHILQTRGHALQTIADSFRRSDHMTVWHGLRSLAPILQTNPTAQQLHHKLNTVLENTPRQ